MKKYLKTYNPWIGFNDLPFILIGTPLVSVIVTMIFFGISVSQALSCAFTNLLPSMLCAGMFWLGDRYITIQFRKKFPAFQDTRKRLIYQGIVILAYTALMAFPLKGAEGLFERTFTPVVPHPGYLKSFVACMFATVPITAIYEAAYFINRWKLSIVETEKLKQENTQSQLEALRNQVNPHFLFNSLNTLASLIPEDPTKAIDFIHRLSHVYRSVLDLKEKTIVTLAEELSYLDHYVFLLKTRFGDNIHFHMDVNSGSKSRYLVPLSVQMLFENAIKHNIVSQKRPLHIYMVNEGDDVLVVRNNLQLKDQQSESTGTGLQNIKNRFQLTFGIPIEVKQTAEEFIVKIPLVHIDQYESTHHRR